ncbi:MAG: 23S rRNA (pseudouridine(1915)-N(3))-methyltransferase RlmH [Pseudomonadota bacterium]
MKLTIIAVGRLKRGPDEALFQHYIDRCGPLSAAVGFRIVPPVTLPENKARQRKDRCAAEAEAILKHCKAGDCLVALDERGSQFTSAEFAGFLQDQQRDSAAGISFLLGGPDGHGDVVLKAASKRLSLSKFTLPHGLARIVLAEQIYRALTIMAGHPYHRP